MFITCDVSQKSNKGLWFLYSGFSNHVTRNGNLFASLDNFVKNEVKLGDGKVVNVVGKGTISKGTCILED